MTAPHRPRTSTERVAVGRVVDGEVRPGRDEVVVEEPMEIRVGPVGVPEDELTALAVVMRTPGNDFELAAGFAVTEGIVAHPSDIRSVAYCGLPPEQQEYNVVTVRIAGDIDFERHRRTMFTTSSCGVCGKASIDAVEVACPHVPASVPIAAAVVADVPGRLRERQKLFDQTGGLHAAGLFTHTGMLRAVREDVGRHNAVDKVVGWAAQQGALALDDHLLAVSGRASFEIVQKAAVAGIAVVVAVSAPSSLAVTAAERLGVTVVGFARRGRFNVYSRPDRIAVVESP
jgi:FdhD protein